MLMTAFSHTVTPCPGGVDIVLTRAADGKPKKFFMAGDSGDDRCKRLAAYMDTLTDGQCEMFYDDAKSKGAKKKDKPKAAEAAAA